MSPRDENDESYDEWLISVLILYIIHSWPNEILMLSLYEILMLSFVKYQFYINNIKRISGEKCSKIVNWEAKYYESNFSKPDKDAKEQIKLKSNPRGPLKGVPSRDNNV